MRKTTYALSLILLFSWLCHGPVWSDPQSSHHAQVSNTARFELTEKPPVVAGESKEPRLDRFEYAIKWFEFTDRRRPPPTGGVVFVGSSTFTKWRELEKTFSEFKAVNRGFGGSTLPEVNHYVSRIVTRYKPSKVVLFCGSNDIAQFHHDGKQVYEDFKKFVELVHTQLPHCGIYFISMSVAPSRLKWEKDFREGNALIEAYIKSSPRLHYINVLPVMRDKNGVLREELFGFDHLHMNSDGYALWTPIIRSALESGK